MESWKNNIFFVLIEPQEPGNIGSAARAIKNMGFENLELVNPIYFLTKEAKWMACQAYDIVKKATVYPSINEAIKDKNLIIGTTRRLGKKRGLIIPLRESIKRIISSAKKNRVAILFGREKNGLTNEEVDKCGFLITIPAAPSAPSLNLAQSVMLVAYEIGHKNYSVEVPKLVKQNEIDYLLKHIESTLKLLEYIPRGNRDLEKKIMRNIKHLIRRGGVTDWEVRMLHGICSQIEKKIISSC